MLRSRVLLKADPPQLHVVKLGKRPYNTTLALQEIIFKAKVSQEQITRKAYAASLMMKKGDGDGSNNKVFTTKIPDVILTVEHTPGVYTVGKRQMPGHFLGVNGGPSSSNGGGEDSLPQLHHGQEVVKLRRGGGVTWHGPGQLTVYPIVSVKRWWEACSVPSEIKGSSPLRWYTAVLEQAIQDGIVAASRGFGATNQEVVEQQVRSRLGARLTGVWFDEKKVASIGLQVSDWISMHGFSVNVTSDPRWFDHIIMCELPGKHATNLSEIAAKFIHQEDHSAAEGTINLNAGNNSESSSLSAACCDEVFVSSLVQGLSAGSTSALNKRQPSSLIQDTSSELVAEGHLSSGVVVHDLKDVHYDDITKFLDNLLVTK